MRSGAFFPYRTAHGAVMLMVESVDGASVVRNEQGSFDAWSRPTDAVRLRLNVHLDTAELGRAAPDGANTIVSLRLDSPDSRCRLLQRVAAPGASFDLELRRSDWLGTVTISAIVTRAAAAAETLPGIASDKGSLLAESAQLVVRFDPPYDRSGGATLPVRWVDFSEHPRHRAVAGHLFALVEDGDEHLPEIHLNTRFEGASPVLESLGNWGAKARIRDAVFAQIGHQAWTSVLGWALDDLARAVCVAGDSELWADIRAEMERDWSADIIEDWAPLLTPSSDGGEAVVDLVDEVRLNGIRRILIEDVPDAVQSRLETYKALTGMLSDIGLLGEVE